MGAATKLEEPVTFLDREEQENNSITGIIDGPFLVLVKGGSEAISQFPNATTFQGIEQFGALQAFVDDLRAKAVEEIIRYGAFPNQWDGYRAPQFKKITIDTVLIVIDLAARFFKVRARQPSKFTPGPVSDGTIDLEISYGSRSIIINLDTDLKKMTISRESEQENTEREYPIGRFDLASNLSWLLS